MIIFRRKSLKISADYNPSRFLIPAPKATVSNSRFTRLRENIEALAKTPEAKQLIARYIAKAGEQESNIENMQKERQVLTAEKESLERQLAIEIKNLEIK